MSEPQAGIFVEGSSAHILLEYRLHEKGDAAALRPVVADAVSALSDGTVNVVWAFGDRCWTQLGGAQPSGLKAFTEVGDALKRAPATQRDILIWLHSDSPSANFDAAMQIGERLAPVAELALEISGFVYHDNRDMTGFIDGTENPKAEGRKIVALIPDGEVGAGGSFILSQKWVHQLGAFKALDQAAQEAVIGRTKPDSVELDDEHMPEDSHVSRSDVKIDGAAQKLYRRSVPYGGVAEHGLYFLAFSAALSRYEHILASMFGVSGDGIHDRLTDFSTPVSGSYWFAPSATELSAIG